MPEDGDMLELDRSALGVSKELEGEDATDSTWTETKPSIKSVDSSALSISEEAHLKSPSISPDSDVQTVKDMQNRAKESDFFSFWHSNVNLPGLNVQLKCC